MDAQSSAFSALSQLAKPSANAAVNESGNQNPGRFSISEPFRRHAASVLPIGKVGIPLTPAMGAELNFVQYCGITDLLLRRR
jgi:hypothetical protein